MNWRASARESDTFPTYMSMYMAQCSNGAIGSGFLPTRTTGSGSGSHHGVRFLRRKIRAEPSETLERRWQLLQQFEKVTGADRSALGKQADDYKTFYADAQAHSGRSALVRGCSRSRPRKKERYGNDEYGLGLILARNILQADAGTRFIYINDGDRWDQHSYIFDRSQAHQSLRNCERFDKGFASSDRRPFLDCREARPARRCWTKP